MVMGQWQGLRKVEAARAAYTANCRAEAGGGGKAASGHLLGAGGLREAVPLHVLRQQGRQGIAVAGIDGRVEGAHRSHTLALAAAAAAATSWARAVASHQGSRGPSRYQWLAGGRQQTAGWNS